MTKSVLTNNPEFSIETQEVIQKLIDNGFGEIVECLLENETKCYTKKHRLNKSATCREMGWKNKQLEDALKGMKELLKDDLDFDSTEEPEED